MSTKRVTAAATLQDVKRTVRTRADYSMAILGLAFVRNGSGRFLNIRAEDRLDRPAATAAKRKAAA